RSEVTHPAQQPAGHARRAAGATGDLARAGGIELHVEDAGAAADDQLEFLDLVEIQPQRDAETLTQWCGENTEARRGADQRERRQVVAHAAHRWSLADDQLELEVFHLRIEDFLHRRIEAMDLVSQQHIARFEIGQQGGEIAGLGDHRARSGLEVDAEFARDDLCHRRLAQARRAVQQHVIQRLAARLRGLDEDLQVFARLLLADEIAEMLRPQMALEFVAFGLAAGDQASVAAGGFAHRASSFSPARISADTSALSPRLRAAAVTAPKASARL